MGDCDPEALARVVREAAPRAVVHVAPTGDDRTARGTATQPYGTLAAAARAAGEDGWVYLHAGTWRESLRVTGSLHLRGACAATTVLEAPAEMEGLVVVGSNAHLDVSDVTVRGGTTGLHAMEGAHVTAARVRWVDAAPYGVRAEGSGTRVALDEVVVTGVRGPMGSEPAGVEVTGATLTMVRSVVADAEAMGVRALTDSTVSLEECDLARLADYALDARASTLRVVRSSIHDGREGALQTAMASRVTIEDTTIRDMRPTGVWTPAFYLNDRSQVALTRTTIKGVVGGRCVALNALNVGTQVTGDRLVIADVSTRGSPRPTAIGIYANEATVNCTHCRIQNVEGIGAFIERGGTCGLTESLVRGIPRGSANTAGVMAQSGGTLHFMASVVEDVAGTGVAVGGPSGRATVERSVIRRTTPGAPTVSGDTERLVGEGITSFSHTRLTVRKTLVTHTTNRGIVVFSDLSTVALEDVDVRHVRSPGGAPGQIRAYGIVLAGTPALEVIAERVRVEDAPGSGVAAMFGAQVHLTDFAVRSLRDDQSAVARYGIGAIHSAHIELRRASLTDAIGTGLLAIDGGDVDVEDAVVRRVRLTARGCCGPGLVAFRNGHLFARRVNVNEAAGAGLYASHREALIEARGVIVKNTIGGRDGTGGRGVVVEDGAHLQASQLAVINAEEIGVQAMNPGSTMEFDGLFIAEMNDETAPRFARGIEVAYGARVSLDNAWLTQIQGIGLVAWGRDAAFSARETIIHHIEPSRVGFGVGGLASDGARVEAERVAIQNVGGAAVIATNVTSAGAHIGIADLYINSVEPQPVQTVVALRDINSASARMRVSYGLLVEMGCDLTVQRTTVGNVEFGFFRAGGVLNADNLLVVRARNWGAEIGTLGESKFSSSSCARMTEHVELFQDLWLPRILFDLHLDPFPPCRRPPCSAREKPYEEDVFALSASRSLGIGYDSGPDTPSEGLGFLFRP